MIHFRITFRFKRNNYHLRICFRQTSHRSRRKQISNVTKEQTCMKIFKILMTILKMIRLNLGIHIFQPIQMRLLKYPLIDSMKHCKNRMHWSYFSVYGHTKVSSNLRYHINLRKSPIYREHYSTCRMNSAMKTGRAQLFPLSVVIFCHLVFGNFLKRFKSNNRFWSLHWSVQKLSSLVTSFTDTQIYF